MGIPKFFRWISERYPMCSQLITEKRVPEFDNLYLDMNGIIHNCTHMDENKKEIPENEAFLAIFKYIEHLFGTIKPKKLFFLSVDGVAPRAKMNQQRSRRFKAAKEAYELYQEKIRKGEDVPENPFDSNCITPGTLFMKRLSEQLKYFINRKVSEDTNWKGIEIIFSGHEVPGEGEHKIMEYIRLSKAQPGYEPNLRHCLYGLDADLIMLGLLSHDPHFCLLREEVLFGSLKKKKQELEEQNFYLMHLCLLREYLEMEFQELNNIPNFPYNFEKIIDDFILLAFFVGNDFLPHLPKLHINEGALALVFKIYKKVIPKAGGYINNAGVINLERLALVLEELENQEREDFKNELEDKNWFDLKKKGVYEEQHLNEKKSLTMTSNQKKLFLEMERFVSGNLEVLELPSTLSIADRCFVFKMADDFYVKCTKYTIEDEEYFCFERDDKVKNSNELKNIINRGLNRYKNAVILDVEKNNLDKENAIFEEKWIKWKDSYYIEKVGFSINDTNKLKEMVENYIEGLQWVLFYYYRGVCSWSWFYKYHYSPKVSDIKKGFTANLLFTLGTPFKPFEQLMAVLPERSKKLVPKPFADLMVNETSPIRGFYPEDFELDMNDKKASWEAIAKIPFINEELLLSVIKTREPLLTDEEKNRNTFGHNIKYTYDENLDYIYMPFTDVFPLIPHCHCKAEIYKYPEILGVEQFVYGLCKGVNLGNTSPAGFPTLSTLPHTNHMDYQGVNVFKSESKNESMIITIQNQIDLETLEEFARRKIGKRVFVGWPYLHEARLNAISTEEFRYEGIFSSEDLIINVSKTHNDATVWKKVALRLELNYKKHYGAIINTVQAIAHVSMLKGLRKTENGAFEKDYEPCNSQNSEHPLQLVLNEVAVEDARYIEKPPLDIKQEYPLGSRGFFLGEYNYGRPLEITAHKNGKIDCWIATQTREPEFGKLIFQKFSKKAVYYPSYVAAKIVGLTGIAFSKLMSSFFVIVDKQKVNLGLNLKYEAKKIKVLGYSRKTEKGWEYTQEAIDLIQEYKKKFPEFVLSVQSHVFDDIPLINKLIPEENYKEKVKEIKSWLKGINDENNFEKVSLDVEQLDQFSMQMVEKELDKISENIPLFTPRRINNVPRNAILKPSQCELRLQDQEFSLGDRVVYVHDSGKVPIATKGIVVRTGKKVVDIIFDVPFMSGTTLGGKCSAYRGLSVETHFVLNLTKRTLIVSTKTSVNKNNIRIEPNTHAMQSKTPLSFSHPGHLFQKKVYPKTHQTAQHTCYRNPSMQPLNTSSFKRGTHHSFGNSVKTSFQNTSKASFQNIPKPYHSASLHSHSYSTKYRTKEMSAIHNT
ncbi:hypothetical protein PMAC_000782 [Pneumocystis sp. 'macacae']|nr:hypothetical protein PMAC_000782 [Pneumocystis sp. 'macacae']